MRRFPRRRRWLGPLLAIAALTVLALVAAAPALAQAGDPAAPSITDDLGSWAALVGLGLPLLVAVLQKATFPSWANSLIFGAAVAVASVVYGFIRFKSDFDWAHWEGAFLAIAVYGIASYKLYWHPPGKADTIVAKVRKNVGVR